MNDNDIFSKRLKHLRTSRELTQEQLARILGISRSAIGMYEKGDRIPPVKQSKKIAEFFNVSIAYLFGEHENKNISMNDWIDTGKELTNEEMQKWINIINTCKNENN